MRINSFNSNIAFCAYKSKFSEHLEYALNSKPDKDIKDLLAIEFSNVFDKHYSREYYMGGGSFHNVYKIDDYYVMRLDKEVSPYAGKYSKNKKLKLEDVDIYYGNVIAKFGNIQILKNAIGDNKAIQSRRYNVLADEKEKVEYKEVFLPAFAAIHQREYDKLASVFVKMNKKHVEFDLRNPNNFILVGDKFKVVDDIDYTKYPNTTLDFLKIFIDFNVCAKPDFTEKDYKNLFTIFKKCIIAAKKSDLPLDEYDEDEYNYLLKKIEIHTPFQEIYDRIIGVNDEAMLNWLLDRFFTKNKLTL